MTYLADKLTYVQVTRKEMSFTDTIFIVIYLPSEVTINYSILPIVSRLFLFHVTMIESMIRVDIIESFLWLFMHFNTPW